MESSSLSKFFLSSCLNLLMQMYTCEAIKRLSFCPCNQKVAPLKIRVSFQQRYYIKKEKNKTKQALKC